MSKLSLPPLGALPPAAQAAFRSVASWANSLEQATTEVRAQQKTSADTIVKQAISAAKETAQQVARSSGVDDGRFARKAEDIARDLLQNMGTLPPIKMNAPQLFEASNTTGGKTHQLGIGAGGIIGGYTVGATTTLTFGVSTDDGSVFFGAEDAAHTADPAHKQIVFDATNSVVTFGADIIIRRSDGSTQTLEDLASGSGYTKTDLEADLSSGVSHILSGVGTNYVMDVNPTSGYIVMGRAGGVYGGYAAPGTDRPALAITSNGIAMGYNRSSDGLWVNSVSLSSAGSLTVSGTINALAGNFATSVTVGGETLGTMQSNASTALSNASAALSGLSSKLSAGATYILGTDIALKTSGYDGGNGLIVTNTGILAKKSGNTTFAIDSAGNATFKGDITGASGTFAGYVNTTGSVNATGVYGSAVGNASVVGVPSNTSYHGVAGISGSGVGIYGKSGSGGYGVYGENLASSSPAVVGYAPSGVDFLASGSKKIGFGGSSTNIRYDGSLFRVSDATSTDAYLLMITAATAASSSGATLAAKHAAGASSAQAGWLTCKVNGTTVYIPYWT